MRVMGMLVACGLKVSIIKSERVRVKSTGKLQGSNTSWDYRGKFGYM